MGILKNIGRFFGIFILLWIIYTKVNINDIYKLLYNINYFYLVVSFLLMILMLIVKSLRIFLSTKNLNVDLNFFQIFRIYINSLLLGQVTTQIVSTISAASATIISSGGSKKIRISNVYILNNVLDLIFALSIMAFSIFFNKEILHLIKINFGYNHTAIILALVGILVFVYIGLKSKISKKIQYIINEVVDSFKLSFKSSFFITILIWIIYSISCYVEARVFSIQIPFTFLLLVYVSGSIITAIPISFAGLGTRDLAFIYLLSTQNVSAEKSFALSFFSFIINPLAALMLLYIIIFLYGVKNET
jgi:uncharacterized membrane protein YbhN (UPF0104 family)